LKYLPRRKKRKGKGKKRALLPLLQEGRRGGETAQRKGKGN